VRSTGSGMGCPDWPKCFGTWIPPTSVNQLPADYKAQFAQYRDNKNVKFAQYLSALGMEDTASKILQDPSVLVEQDFNATKTWTEYLNRLVGAIIGLLFIALFIASWRVRAISPVLFTGSGLALGLVIFQGWFGSIVVSTNLTTWTVTIHLLLALLLVMILIFLLVRSGETSRLELKGVRGWLLAGMSVILLQTLLGTRVREAIDRLSPSIGRDSWITNAGSDFLIHRTFSWVVLAIQLLVYMKLRKMTAEKTLTLIPFLLILCSLLTGTAMAYFGVPPSLQPVHLVLAVLSFGWFFQVYLLAGSQRSPVLSN